MVVVGDSMDITGGTKGPVGIEGACADFAIPTKEAVEISSATMNVRVNAVFFIQQRITIH